MIKYFAKKTINASELKWIAIIAMILDHFAAIILTPLATSNLVSLQLVAVLHTIILCLRLVGRIAFPIFSFLIVNGYFHTSNRRRYLARLVLFAILSEPFFNFGLSQGSFIDSTAQNVFFTLALGLSAIWSYDVFKEREGMLTAKGLLSLSGCLLAAMVIKCDYDVYGVLLIFLMYLTYQNATALTVVTAGLTFMLFGQNLMSTPFVFTVVTQMGFQLDSLGYFMAFIMYCFNNLQLMSLLACWFITRYNGQKGNVQYPHAFYVFYPVHLFLFGLISLLIMNS